MFTRRFGKPLTLILFLALVVEIVVFSPRSTGPENPQNPANAEARDSIPTNEQWIEGVHLTETAEGKKEWELLAAQAKSVKDKNSWELKKVEAKFFGQKSADEYFHVVGDEGHVITASKDMSVKGQVVVKSHNGYEFRTDSVVYSSEKKILTTNDPIVMVGRPDDEGETMELKGIGLVASIDQQTMDIVKDVRLERKLSDGRQVVVRSETARFYSQNKSADFKGQVVVDIGASRITGPLAKFVYDAEKKALSSMEVEGGVNMTDAEKWASARKIEMSFLNDEFVLKGAPKMTQNSEELTGTEIKFSDGGRKVEVKGGRAVFDSKSLGEK